MMSSGEKFDTARQRNSRFVDSLGNHDLLCNSGCGPGVPRDLPSP
jgi:hypothetical protein